MTLPGDADVGGGGSARRRGLPWAILGRGLLLLVLAAGLLGAGYSVGRLEGRQNRSRFPGREAASTRGAVGAGSPSGPVPSTAVSSPLEDEARALRDAMCAYLTDVDHVGPGQCGRRDLFGLATVIVTEVDRFQRNGEWLPLGRRKAPALLAGMARFECSWEWRDVRPGHLGEVGIFQLGKGAIRHAGYTEHEVRRSPASATRAAILWLNRGTEECRYRARLPGYTQGPETWLGWYATRGVCGGARAEVEKRLDAARWMLRRMEAQ
jgi:hypothetical protein